MTLLDKYFDEFYDAEILHFSNNSLLKLKSKPRAMYFIYSPPILEIFILGFISIIILIFVLFGTIEESCTVVICFTLVFLIWWEIFHARKIESVFFLDNNRFFHFKRHGFLGTMLNVNELNLPLSDILRIEIKRHAYRGKDGFELRLNTKNYGVISLTGKRIRFDDCQSIADYIRDFLNIEEKLVAID